MWDVSGRWDDAIRRAHDVVTTIEVWQNGSKQTTLNCTGGTVTLDEGSKVRRTISFDCSDVALEPDDAADLLSPFGTDLHVFSGITYTEGDTELVPLGVFRIGNTTRASILAGLSITGSDYSQPIADDRFVTPWNTPAGSAIVDEIARIVHDFDSTIEVYDLTGSQQLTAKATFEQERWDAIESLAASIGAEAAFDQVGRLIVRPVPMPTSTSDVVWVVDAGYDTAVITDVATGLSAEGVYNAVVASSSSAGDNPVSSVVYQSSGPLAWRAGFKRPRFYSSPLLKTADACTSAATAILARSAVYSRQINPIIVPNPALDVGDFVQVVMADGTTEIRALSKITVPLDLNPMDLETRIGIDYTATNDASTL